MNDPAALINAVIHRYNSGQVDEAAYLLTQLPYQVPGIEQICDYHVILALITNRHGKQHLAANILRKALATHSRRGDVAQLLGNMLLHAGDLREAAYYLMRARRLEQFAGKEDVFVFGDSHSDHTFSGIPRCRVVWLPGMTMHRVGRDGLGAFDIGAHGLPPGAAAVLIFGEIDIRAHVVKQMEAKGRELPEILSTLCAAYLRTACLNRDRVPGVKMIVSSVHPPTMSQDTPDSPFHGTIEQRVAITREVNRMLQALCAENGLRFLNLYPYFADPCGTLTRALSDEVVHVRREYSDIVEYELERTLD